MRKANLTFIFGPLHGKLVPQRAWERGEWRELELSHIEASNRGKALPDGTERLPTHFYERVWTPGGYAMQYKGLMQT